MNVIYDIREQNPLNNSVAVAVKIGIGVILAVAFIIVLVKLVMSLLSKIKSSKISIVLNFVGLIFIPIIALSFNSKDINNDYYESCKSIDQNICFSITGKPEITRKYRPKGYVGKYPDGFVGEYVEVTIKGVEFDTYELYQSEGVGFNKTQIDAIVNAENLTVKYLEGDIVNTILFIGVE